MHFTGSANKKQTCKQTYVPQTNTKRVYLSLYNFAILDVLNLDLPAMAALTIKLRTLQNYA